MRMRFQIGLVCGVLGSEAGKELLTIAQTEIHINGIARWRWTSSMKKRLDRGKMVLYLSVMAPEVLDVINYR